MLFLLVGPHGSSETDQQVEGIHRRKRLPGADRTDPKVVTPARCPLKKGAGTVEGIVLEAKDAHEIRDKGYVTVEKGMPR